MPVDIKDEQDVPIDLKRLQDRVEAALLRAGYVDAEVSLLLTDDTRMTELNERYRGLDKTTDVLSFSLQENDSDLPFGEFLGDIVISVPTARKHADEAGVPLEQEIETLALHGLLHLLGHDHEAEGWESWETALKEIHPDA